jgi:predicted RND superfamily exporter protein
MTFRGLLYDVLLRIARHPWRALALVALAVLPLAAAASGLKPDNSLSVWFVADDPALADYRAFQREFGNDEVVVVAYRPRGDPLGAEERAVQRALAARLAGVAGIDRVLSPGAAYEAMGGTAGARAYLRRAGMLGRGDSVVSLLARVSPRHDIDEVRGRVLDDVLRASEGALSGGRVPHYAGIGVLYDALNRETIRESGIYLGLAFAVMAVLLWLTLRRVRAVLVALVPCTATAVATLGVYALSGRPFTQVTAILPMLVLVIGVSDAIHLVSHHDEERGAHPGGTEADRRRLVARAAAWVALPNLFTALTTAAGFAALATSRMPAVRDLGVFAAVAMLVGWVLTLVLGTAALALRDLPPRAARARGGLVDRAVDALARHVPRRPWTVVAATLAATAALLVGAARMRVDTYTMELLTRGHPARLDSRWIEENAGFYMPLEMIVTAAPGTTMRDPALLRLAADWQRRAERGEAEGAVLDRTFGAPDVPGIALPAPPDGAAARAYLSADGRRARVTAFVPMTSTRGFARTAEALEGLGREVFGGRATVRASGYVPLYLRIIDYTVQGTVRGLAVSTLIVFAMIGLLLRSLRLTAAAVPTNLFPVALVFGVMGFGGIPLDVATATIGAIVLGISVDDTIHFLFRYREERASGRTRGEAVSTTFRATGRAVIFASVVLALGFAVLTVSGSRSISSFGLVSAVSIAGAMLADLFLLPVLLVGGSARAPRAADDEPGGA